MSDCTAFIHSITQVTTRILHKKLLYFDIEHLVLVFKCPHVHNGYIYIDVSRSSKLDICKNTVAGGHVYINNPI